VVSGSADNNKMPFILLSKS